MKAVLIVIGLMLLPLGALASEENGVLHTFPNSHQNIGAAKVSPKLNFPKHKSDNLAGVISSERSTLKELDKTLKELDASLTQYNGQESKSLWEKFKTDPNATFAGFVALFTLGLVIVGFLQVTQMKKTLEATLKTAESTLATAEATKTSGEAVGFHESDPPFHDVDPPGSPSHSRPPKSQFHGGSVWEPLNRFFR